MDAIYAFAVGRADNGTGRMEYQLEARAGNIVQELPATGIPVAETLSVGQYGLETPCCAYVMGTKREIHDTLHAYSALLCMRDNA